MLSEPATPSKSSDTLKAELRAVNKELTLMKKQWLEEKRQLMGDKAVLQDAASKLNTQIREAERRADDVERAVERVRSLLPSSILVPSSY